jgi:Na+-transporting NADH:ubiquinone oxidoreductase subunit NqrE
VFSPIIFLPLILLICAIIGGLIVLTRRMVRGPVAFPPLPRL